MTQDANASLQKLRDVVNALLGPDGCPWDKKQTPLSLCDYVLEEAYELVDAVRRGDDAEAAEELGDLAFLLLFVARLYEEKGAFTLEDSLDAIAAKMIRRHPHVFADVSVNDHEDVMRNWEQIKRGEKKDADSDDGPRSLFASLPASLPPMLRAYRIHSKAARSGFTWENEADVAGQLDEEWREFQDAAASGDQDAMEREFGDYLFTLIELGRRKGIKANAALHLTNNTFLQRFAALEEFARKQGRDVASMSLDELNELWALAKRKPAAP